MAKMTLGDAAKASGFSKPTISRAIKLGKISAEKLENGSYQIDPSELQRWIDSNDHRNHKPEVSVTPQDSELKPSAEIQLMLLEQENKHLQEKMEIYRARLEKSDKEKEQLTLLLSAPAKRAKWFGIF